MDNKKFVLWTYQFCLKNLLFDVSYRYWQRFYEIFIYAYNEGYDETALKILGKTLLSAKIYGIEYILKNKSFLCEYSQLNSIMKEMAKKHLKKQ